MELVGKEILKMEDLLEVLVVMEDLIIKELQLNQINLEIAERMVTVAQEEVIVHLTLQVVAVEQLILEETHLVDL